MRQGNLLIFLHIIAIVAYGVGNVGNAEPSETAIASNESYTTLCAEEDNINIPFSGDVSSFIIEAIHPTYEVGTDNCAADFSNCPAAEPGYHFTPAIYQLFDDGETAVEAVREAEWWRPNGMEVSVDAGTPVTNIHYVRLYRKIADANEWPQYFVLYMDGNLRLIPHPPEGITSVCFGSSVIIGPAATALRPTAEISSARYISTSKTMEVLYQTGGSAILDLQEVNRTNARIQVNVDYPTGTLPFATFRSMFVINGNADVDHVWWKDTSGTLHDDPVITFLGGGGTEWLFYRSSRSQHNTSAPDIRIKLDSGNNGNGGNGNDGCFIATAAYGSYLDPHVMALKDFRDDYLVSNLIGRSFVTLYYKISPSIADFISRDESSKIFTRWALIPVVYGAKYPVSALLILLSLIMVSMVWRSGMIKKFKNHVKERVRNGR